MRATTLLGDNTIPILRSLVDAIHEATGVQVGFDVEMPLDERERGVREGSVDVVFACGLLTAEMVRDGVPIGVVAAPIFPGETAAVYRSVIVARSGSAISTVVDGLSARLAINEYGSWSGWRAYEHHVASLGRSADEHPTTVISGGHTRSVAAVKDGHADIASIDSSIWRDLSDQERCGLVALDATQDWPAPPLSLHRDVPEPVRRAVRALTGGDAWVAADDGDYDSMLG